MKSGADKPYSPKHHKESPTFFSVCVCVCVCVCGCVCMCVCFFLCIYFLCMFFFISCTFVSWCLCLVFVFFVFAIAYVTFYLQMLFVYVHSLYFYECIAKKRFHLPVQISLIQFIIVYLPSNAQRLLYVLQHWDRTFILSFLISFTYSRPT